MELLSEAIEFAVSAHDTMRRKGCSVPYILHPMEAAVVAGTMTDDQEVLAAAVLHDVVEDADISPEEIEEKFGKRVRELVMSETEDKRDDLPPTETWLIRKQESLEFLKNCSDKAVKILYLGDKLSNLRSINRDLAEMGPKLWQRFHQKDPQQHHWYYREIADATRDMADTWAWKEYNSLVETIFHERND